MHPPPMPPAVELRALRYLCRMLFIDALFCLRHATYAFTLAIRRIPCCFAKAMPPERDAYAICLMRLPIMFDAFVYAYLVMPLITL